MTISHATPRHSGLAPGGGPRAASRGPVTAALAAQHGENEANLEAADLAPERDEKAVGKSQVETAADEVVQNSGDPSKKVPAPSPVPNAERKRAGRPPGPTRTLARAELVYEFRRTLGLTATEAERALAAMEMAIRTALERGETVKLNGIGSFSPVRLKERSLRNPHTGESYTASPTKVRFKAAANLRAAIAISL